MENMFRIYLIIVMTLAAIKGNRSDGDVWNRTNCTDTQQIFILINSLIEKAKNFITLSPTYPKIIVTYYLYTRQNPHDYQKLTLADPALLKRSNFNRNRPVRFIISGWMNVHNSCAGVRIKDAYLQKGDFNVIIVNWDEISVDIDYVRLSLIVDRVGLEFAKFAKYLNHSENVPFAGMYVIGYSLGAQIAGSAGKQLAPDKFKTIFALEPAGPMFHGLGFDRRVDASDAEYVESIQTNIGIAGYYGEGGRASFYPNYGHIQPHCSIYNPGCNHAAAYEYFVESITAGEASSFYGLKCESFNKLAAFNKCNCKFHGNCVAGKMGGEPATPKSGVYFLRTNKSSPFSRLWKNFTQFTKN